MRAVILFFTLCAGFLLLSRAKADSFQTLNSITVTITDTELDYLATSMQDENYIYFFTLVPLTAYKFNKTQLATPGWNNGPIAKINVTDSETVVFGLLDEGTGLILLQGQKSTFFVSSANLSLVHTFVGQDRNSLTGFLSEDSDGVSVANLVSYGGPTANVLQIRLDDPLANETSLFDLTPGLYYQASSYYNDIAILASFTSEFFVYNWTTKELLLTFKINDQTQSTIVTAYDSERNVLYACGDRHNSDPPVLTRLDLSRIQNESTISFSLSSSSPYYESDAVIAQTIGPEGSTCRDLVLHPSSGQLVYAVYDPPSALGFIGRAIASTLDTIETKDIEAYVSPKPARILIDTNKPLIYVATETDVAVIKLPTTFNCPLDCSDRGHCNSTTNYRCVCDVPYSGRNCEIQPIPVPPVEQPYYQPVKLLGRVGLLYNLGSVFDEDNIYYITNCSVAIGKISKLDVLASKKILLSNATTSVLADFGVTGMVADPQVGVIYLFGTTKCNKWEPDHTSQLVRVSMDDFKNHTEMDLPPIETSFVSYDGYGSYLNALGWNISMRFNSSKTYYPSQTSLSSIPATTDSLLASVFLPRSNTGIVVTDYATVHYDFPTDNTTLRYFLPYGFTAESLAADEQRGKLYIVGTNWVTKATYLVVLTPALIPFEAFLSVNATVSYAKWIDLKVNNPSRAIGLFLDLEAGQAIIVQEDRILRINLLTHEIFDKVNTNTDTVQSAHYDTNTSTLFVTSPSEAAAFYIPPPCPRNCSGHGQCVYGACVCNDGFTGDLCDPVIPPVNPPVEEPVSEPVTEPFTIPIANIASDAVSVVPMISLVAAAIVLVNLV